MIFAHIEVIEGVGGGGDRILDTVHARDPKLEEFPGRKEYRARDHSGLSANPNERSVGEVGDGILNFPIIGSEVSRIGIEVQLASEEKRLELLIVSAIKFLRMGEFEFRFGAILSKSIDSRDKSTVLELLLILIVGREERKKSIDVHRWRIRNRRNRRNGRRSCRRNRWWSSRWNRRNI